MSDQTVVKSRTRRTLYWMSAAMLLHAGLLGVFALVNYFGGRHLHGDGYTQFLPMFPPVRVAAVPFLPNLFSFTLPEINRAWSLLIGPIWVGILFVLMLKKDGSPRPTMKVPLFAGILPGILTSGVGLALTFGPSRMTSTFILDRTVSINVGFAFLMGIGCAIVALVRGEKPDDKSTDRRFWTVIFSYVGTAGAMLGLVYGLPFTGLGIASTVVAGGLGVGVAYVVLAAAAGSITLFGKGLARLRNR